MVWIREHDPTRENVTPGMGVRFDKLTPESQPTLEQDPGRKAARLEQAGLAAAGQPKSGRRWPCGGRPVCSPASTPARAPPSGRPAAPARPVPRRRPSPFPPAPAVPPPPSPSGLTSSPLRRGATQPRVAVVPARPPPEPPPAAFSRARATLGSQSALGRCPGPSALFEPPTGGRHRQGAGGAAENRRGSRRPRVRRPSAPRYVATTPPTSRRAWPTCRRAGRRRGRAALPARPR